MGELVDDLVNFTAHIDVHVQRGHRTVEVHCGGIDKGVAASLFLPQDPASFVLAIGDDWTDENLFRVLPGSAFTIRVGREHSLAEFNLRNHEEVLALLREIAERHP